MTMENDARFEEELSYHFKLTRILGCLKNLHFNGYF